MDMQTGSMFNMPAWHLTDVVHARSYILGDEYLLTSIIQHSLGKDDVE